MKRPLIWIVALLAIVLVACGTPPPADPDPDPDPTPPETLETVTLTVNSPAAEEMSVLGAAMMVWDMEEIDAGVPTSMAVIEAAPGMYVGPISNVNTAGQVDLILPAGEDIATAVQSPAAEFIYGLDYATCTLSTSVTGVNVTELSLTEWLSPGVLAFYLMGSTPGFVTTTPVDFEDPEFEAPETLITWLYASAAVNIATPVDGCALETVDLTVDLSLEEGWNQVALNFVPDPELPEEGTLEITNSEAEELYLSPEFFGAAAN